MSIKHFSNRPCPECKKDTMHFVAKCTECGVAQPDQYELRGKSIRRHFARLNTEFRYRNAYLKNKKDAEHIRQNNNAALPSLAPATQMTEAMFGTGRTRTKA